MHQNDIIIRDLNLKDLIVDNKGKINITKFENAKFGVKDCLNGCLTNNEKQASLVPEIIDGFNHGKAVDWYLLGTLIYEMIIGVTPYYSINSSEHISNIMNSKLKITKNLSPLAKDIIIKLLNRNPS